MVSVVLLGLSIYAANGLFEKKFVNIITLAVVSLTIVFVFNKLRNKLSPKEYRIGMATSIIFFICISVHIFLQPSQEKSDKQKTVFSPNDSIITALNDSIKRIQPSLELAKLKESNANEKLELAKKYIKSTNKPIISVGEPTIDTLLPNKPVVIHCRIENKGNASAERLIYSIDVCFHTVEYYDGEFYSGEFSKPLSLTPQTSIANVTVGTGLLSQKMYDSIQTKKLYLYYFGIVYYRDEFGTKDSTAFCLIYNANTKNIFTYNTSHNY